MLAYNITLYCQARHCSSWFDTTSELGPDTLLTLLSIHTIYSIDDGK